MRFGLVVICMLVAVCVTVNLILIPLLVLLVKDPKGEAEYGIEINQRSSLNDADFTDNYKSTIGKLEVENKHLKDTIKRDRSSSQGELLSSPTEDDNSTKMKRVSVL